MYVCTETYHKLQQPRASSMLCWLSMLYLASNWSSPMLLTSCAGSACYFDLKLLNAKCKVLPPADFVIQDCACISSQSAISKTERWLLSCIFDLSYSWFWSQHSTGTYSCQKTNVAIMLCVSTTQCKPSNKRQGQFPCKLYCNRASYIHVDRCTI